jgi:preprotein translocase subunit SecE
MAKDKGKKKAVATKKKKSNAIVRLWRETVGELRKVSWPTTQEAWRLTRIVIVVMVFMSFLLGLFDFLFSKLIAILYA